MAIEEAACQFGCGAEAGIGERWGDQEDEVETRALADGFQVGCLCGRAFGDVGDDQAVYA